MPHRIQPLELSFFVQLVGAGSLTSAARGLGVTVPAVSRKLAQLESRVGKPLLNRTTRRMSLTTEGDVFLQHARRILHDIDVLQQLLTQSENAPTGLLRINTTFGFGRAHVAPAIVSFTARFPEIQIELQLTSDHPPFSEDAFDLCLRFGEPPDERVVAKKIARHRRVFCASPAYLAAQGEPLVPADLASHKCIALLQGENAYETWRLSKGKGKALEKNVRKVRGQLCANDGETVVNWALNGLGIVMAADWLVGPFLKTGKLTRVLREYETPGADIFAVYLPKHHKSMRVQAFVEHLGQRIAHLDTADV